MTLKVQMIILCGLLVIMAVIIAMVRKRMLELQYVLVWMACDIALMILTIFPQLMDAIADLLGIYSTMNMMFFLGILFLLLICLSLTIAVSRMAGKLRKVAQMLAMLPDEIKDEYFQDRDDK